MKKSIIIIGIIGVFIGLFSSWGMYEGITRTAGEQFCISCHEMRPMVSSYHNDVHGGNGKVGIKVSCVSCHLPHDNLANYVFTKAVTGTKEVGIHFLGNPDEINWFKMREQKESFVYDAACIGCHTNYKDNKSIPQKGIQMHAHYDKLKNTDEQISCVSCHVEIGHSGLRSTLNYYKAEYDFYNGKLDKKRELVDKKLTEDMNKVE